jgi:hypothetical protein
MPIAHFEELLAEAERRAIAQAVRAHPEWTLDQLFTTLSGPRGEVLGSLTVHELRAGASLGPVVIPSDGVPPIDHARLERAQRLRGDEYSSLVREVLAEAPGPVGAGYLRARLGGPRWKLLAALRELKAANVVMRSGATSSTRYWLNSNRPAASGPTKAVTS